MTILNKLGGTHMAIRSREIRKCRKAIGNIKDFITELETELEWVNRRICALENHVDDAISDVESMPDRMLYTKSEIGQIEELRNLVTHRTRLSAVITNLKMALTV